MGRIALVFCLVFEIAFPYALRAESLPRKTPRLPTLGKFSPLTGSQQALVHGFEDPLLNFLGRTTAIPLTVALGPDDPALDANPFFLRGQRWLPTDTTTEIDPTAIGAIWENDRLQIALPGARRRLELPSALRPLGIAGEYLWLSPLDDEFFDSPLEGDRGEGVFLVRLDDLSKGETNAAPVPVFYFPLPGTRWTGPKVTVADFPLQDGALLLDDDGVPLPIQLDDVDTVVDAERINLLLAIGLSARSEARGHAITGSTLPLPKSTAGFGLLFTGFDVEANDFLFDKASMHTSNWAKARAYLHAAAGQWFIGHAEADATDEATAAANKLYESLTRVGAVLALSSIAAVVLKYSIFDEQFRKQHAEEDAQRGQKPGWLGRRQNDGKDIGTVLAHNLTVLSNFASIWFGHGVQYTIDRHFPALGSGKNQRLNRFLDATVYFTKSSGEKLPVNYRTLLLGALVLGGVDSVLVAAQLYFVVPWMAQAYAAAVPGSAAKVNEIFQLGNPMTEVYNRNESIRNFASYLASGASAFSSQLRSQLMTVYGPAVDEDMRKEGLDPLDIRHKDTRDSRLEEKLGKVFHQLGLPGQEDFLFDATTLWKGSLSALGYSATELAQGKFIGDEHPGLVISALKRARKEAQRREALNPSDATTVAARQLLEVTLRDAGKLRQLSGGGLRAVGAAVTQSWQAVKAAVTHPLTSAWNVTRHPLRSLGRFFGPVTAEIVDSAKLLRVTRQRLFALTNEGPLGQDLQNLPSEWIQVAGQPGATMAGHLFRRAFFGYLEGDPAVIEGAPDERWLAVDAKRRETAEQGAVDALKRRYAAEFASLLKATDGAAALAEKELTKIHGAEYLLLAEDAVEQAWREQEDEKVPYTPPKRGWFKKRQDRAAARLAAAQFRARTAKVFDPSVATAEDFARYRKLYTESSMNGVGLYPNFEGMEELEAPIGAAAEAITQAQLEQKKVAHWLETLSAEEATDFRVTLYAENYASAYTNVVSNAVEGLAQNRFADQHPQKRAFDPQKATKAEKKVWRRLYASAVMAPGQPGRLQWLRQNRVFKKIPFASRIARSVEAFFPIEAHQKGFWNFFYRNVPGSSDFVLANKLVARRLLTLATASYWSVYLIWGVALPLHLWILAQATSFTVTAPWYLLNRFCRLHGLKPMSGVLAMAAYAFVGSWVTMGGTFPMLWYEKDMAELLKWVGANAHAGLGAAGDVLHNAMRSCATFLGGGSAP